jgi:Phosphotransferase enzyme family
VEEVELAGGVANAGAVVRVGPHVLRPSNPNSASIHRFLSALRAAGFDGASEPVGIDADGRERLVFIDGDVPLPPYPDWARADAAIVSVAVLIRRLHDAAASIAPLLPAPTWSDEMADPQGGPIICHNDVCLENVVFRGGVAVGLLDFDFAAPGRRVHDVAQFARMCVPIDDGVNALRFGWTPDELHAAPARVRLVCDAYGLDADERHELVEIVSEGMALVGRFVRRRMEAGDPNFTKMWHDLGGAERYERRHRWWVEHRPDFEAALV